METHYRLKSPEVVELEIKQAELSRLKLERVSRQEALERLKSELRTFEKVYDQLVGRRIAELDLLEAQISNPKNGGTDKKNIPGSEWSGHLHASDLIREDDESPVDIAQKSLRSLYREVAKSIHPDLALNEEERAKRQELMAFANSAYADGNRQALLDILKEWEHAPEKIRGKDIGAELVKVIRLIAKEREEIHAVDVRLEELKETDTFIFKLRVDQALAKGIDLLAEMAATVDLNIANARRRLFFLRGEAVSEETNGCQLDNRIIRFPPETICGILYVRKKGSANYCDWQKLCAAKGARRIPLGMAARLDARGDCTPNLSFLKELQPGDLQSLFLYEIGNDTLGFIKHLSSLEELYISDSTVTDDGMKTLALLPDLTRVYLYHTDITDAGLVPLYGLKKLVQFTCSGTLISDTGLERLRKAIPGINTLNFPWRYGKKQAARHST